jgi:Ca2+:H+ antiporter
VRAVAGPEFCLRLLEVAAERVSSTWSTNRAPSSTTLLALTLFVSTLTLGTGRTTVLQGAIHLVIFVAFLLLSAVP